MNTSIEEIKKSLKRNPKDPYVHLGFGTYLLNQKNFREAVREYKIALGFSPRIAPDIIIDFEEYLGKNLESVDAWLALVDFHLSLGNIEAAQIELEELVEIAPETAYVYNLLGRIYLRLGKFEGAIALFEKALKPGRGDAALLEALAGAYIEKERISDAISIYEQILKSDPKSKRVLRTIRELYVRLKDYEGAAKICADMLVDDAEVLAEVEEFLRGLIKASPNSTFIREQIVKVYIMSLKPDKAVAQLEKIIKLDEGKYDAAISYLRKILSSYPDHIASMLLLAYSLTKKGSVFTEAVELYNKALNLNPDLIDKAISGYKLIITAYPEQILARQSLADAFFKKNMVQEALDEYKFVVRSNPEEIDKIEKKCREILKQNPKMHDAYLVQAQAYLTRGEARKAISIAEELVGKDKKNVEAHIILGDAYAKIGILKSSKDSYREAIKLSPYNLDVKRKYKEIYEKNIENDIALLKSKIEQDPWRVALNLDLAKLLYAKNSLDQALRSLQYCLKDKGRAPYAHNLMGLIFKEQGRFDLAQVQFEKALEFKIPDDQNLVKMLKANLGSCHEAQGNVSKAVSCFEDVLSIDLEFGSLKNRIKKINEINPFSMRNKILAVFFESDKIEKIFFVWGEDIRKNKGDYGDLTLISFGLEQNNLAFDNALKGSLNLAEEEFALAKQLDENLHSSVNNLGAVFLKNRNFDQAISKFMEALALDNSNAVYHSNLAAAYALKGDFDNAQKHFMNALKLNKDLNAANINMGDLCMKKTCVKEAIEYYKNIDQFDPLYEAAERRLI